MARVELAARWISGPRPSRLHIILGFRQYGRNGFTETITSKRLGQPSGQHFPIWNWAKREVEDPLPPQGVFHGEGRSTPGSYPAQRRQNVFASRRSALRLHQHGPTQPRWADLDLQDLYQDPEEEQEA